METGNSEIRSPATLSSFKDLIFPNSISNASIRLQLPTHNSQVAKVVPKNFFNTGEAYKIECNWEKLNQTHIKVSDMQELFYCTYHV